MKRGSIAYTYFAEKKRSIAKLTYRELASCYSNAPIEVKKSVQELDINDQMDLLHVSYDIDIMNDFENHGVDVYVESICK
jgi:hypothetical protein